MRRSDERQLEALEASYRNQLLAALRNCAKGRWGLFGQNEQALRKIEAAARSRLSDPSVDELLELGSKIDGVRRRHGLESFVLHQKLLEIRSSYNSNSPGEPKLAQQWLDDLQ